MSDDETNSSLTEPRQAVSRSWLSRFPPLAAVLESMPARRRPALYFETLANLGTGGVVRLFPISLVVLETILHADLWYQTLLASIFFGGNLLSPIVTWFARHIRVRWLVILPSFVMALLLAAIVLKPDSAGFFTMIVCLVLGLRVVMQIGEMNMFRLLYPDSHLSRAVGWTRSVSAFSGLLLTLLSWWWIEFAPEYYWGLFLVTAIALTCGSWFYAKIPVHQSNHFSIDDKLKPVPAFLQGVKVFVRDKRFFRYEMAFFIVGLANQMSIYLVPNVLNEYVQAGKTSISLIAIVIPSVTIILTAPLWGSYLSGRTPMLARGTFSLMQVWTFSLYAYGGLAGVVWPFYIGSFIHACSIAGGSINWLTGNLYFARPEHTALYNGIHVFMTGLRGCLAPFVARIIYVEGTTGLGFVGWNWGPWIFLISVVLSAIGAAMFFYSQQQEARSETGNSSGVA